jgi:hypothetical protein
MSYLPSLICSEASGATLEIKDDLSPKRDHQVVGMAAKTPADMTEG